MNGKRDEGFSLIEVLVAIAVLAIFVIPTCSSLVMSLRMTDKTDSTLHAQLTVSSAVEQLMATGIEVDKETGEPLDYSSEFTDIEITVDKVPDESTGDPLPYYKVTVIYKPDESISVTTHIRKAVPVPEAPAEPEQPEEGGNT